MRVDERRSLAFDASKLLRRRDLRLRSRPHLQQAADRLPPVLARVSQPVSKLAFRPRWLTPGVPFRQETEGVYVGERAQRARHYLAAVPPAIAGQHGDAHTF